MEKTALNSTAWMLHERISLPRIPLFTKQIGGQECGYVFTAADGSNVQSFNLIMRMILIDKNEVNSLVSDLDHVDS